MDSPEAYPAWDNAGGGAGTRNREAEIVADHFRVARHPRAIGGKLQMEVAMRAATQSFSASLGELR